MEEKEVAPSSKNEHTFLKRFAIALFGGVVGALLTIGIFYIVSGAGIAPNNPASGSPNAGNTKVSNVKVDANSDITSAVNKVQGAVVSVINLQKQKSQNSLGDLFGEGANDQQEEGKNGDLVEASEGSGVIYKREGTTAYIVTNNHVVENQSGLEVLLTDGSKVPASLVGTDAYTDLAVLKIQSDKVGNITPAVFGDSSKLKVGEPAIALGSPLGSKYANSVTSGIVSSLNRQVVNKNESGQTININAIQTDAAINPGNSGGPLVNIAGQVIGINSSKIVQTESNVNVEGIGFSIPSNDVVNVINQIEKDGKVIRPALGISMVDLSDLSTAQQKKVVKIPSDLTKGVVVANVQAATPAEKAGLKQYDVITKINDTDVTSGIELQSVLYKHKVGDTVKVTYYRENKKQTTNVELSLDTDALKKTTQQQKDRN